MLNRLYDPFLLKFLLDCIFYSFPPKIAGVDGKDFLLIDFSLDFSLNLEFECAISEEFSSFIPLVS